MRFQVIFVAIVVILTIFVCTTVFRNDNIHSRLNHVFVYLIHFGHKLVDIYFFDQIFETILVCILGNDGKNKLHSFL